MILEHRAQSVELNKMLPNKWWGSCHVVTEGAAKRSFAVNEGIFEFSLLTPNSSLQNTGGIL